MNPMDTETMQVPENEAPTEPQPSAGVSTSGPVDLEAIRSKMNIPPDLQDIYDKCIINGRRIMFSKETFGETSKYLDGPEPMGKKIADGIVAVVTMMYKKSNETLNPKVIVPATLGLTLDGFEFLQEKNHPEATKETLGQAVELATFGVMKAFKVPEDQIEQLVAQNKAAVEGGAPTGAPPPPPEQPGILGAA